MIYNKLIADFIQYNYNICNSWEYHPEETMCNNYPFKNSYDEIVSTLYYLKNEEEELAYSTIEDTLLSLNGIISSLESCVKLLEEIKEKYTDNFNKILNSREFKVVFNFTDGNNIDDYIEAYKMWLEGIKNS